MCAFACGIWLYSLRRLSASVCWRFGRLPGRRNCVFVACEGCRVYSFGASSACAFLLVTPPGPGTPCERSTQQSQHMPLREHAMVPGLSPVAPRRLPIAARHPGEYVRRCGLDCCCSAVKFGQKPLFGGVGGASDRQCFLPFLPCATTVRCAGVHVGADGVPSPQGAESERVSRWAVGPRAAEPRKGGGRTSEDVGGRKGSVLPLAPCTSDAAEPPA